MDKLLIKEMLVQTEILCNLSEDLSPALQKKGLDFGFIGDHVTDGVSLKIQVGFDRHFPKHKPIYFLVNHEEIVFIPHIEEDGTICYTHDENLVMDANNPKGIIQETFSLVEKTLVAGIRKENQQDFLNEFEAYWVRLKDAGAIFTNVEVKNSVEVIKIGKHKDSDEEKTLFAVSESEDRINSITRFIDTKNTPPLQNGIYIPLQNGSIILPPRSNTQLTLAYVRDLIFNNLSAANQKKLKGLLEKKTKLEEFLIISFPKPNGNNAFFGIRIAGINYARHPLLHQNDKVKINALAVSRLDKEYMLARGGNGMNFTDKKVLVIGGGSVGGYIAEELIKSSILKVDIIDSENLEIENCYRHVCGFGYLNKNKAKALKLKLEQLYPHSEIGAFPELIETIIEKRKIDFTNYDAIVIATGNATINLYLTKYFHEVKSKVPLLFSWLDPYGIGGHCLITNITDKGCYKCLYSNDELYNKASFASSKQPKPFLKSISGCATVYSPYSSMDACQSALLVVRKVASVFNAKETENAIYSWKGNPDQFISEGFNLSDRYNQTSEELEAKKSIFYDSNCESCGK
ncbi:MAG: hypothetical protein E6H08_10995 [Bacteroidetes bacterium]|nr:MAG: hypothetical protein E6H08_10995 [Bacteroidota bacterium]